MPFGGRGKPIQDMTRRDIVSALAAFTVIGGFLLVASAVALLRTAWGWLSLIPAAGMGFVVAAVTLVYVRLIGELRRRNR